MPLGSALHDRSCREECERVEADHGRNRDGSCDDASSRLSPVPGRGGDVPSQAGWSGRLPNRRPPDQAHISNPCTDGSSVAEVLSLRSPRASTEAAGPGIDVPCGPLVAVRPSDTVRVALESLLRNRAAPLAVTEHDGTVVGAFSASSFLRTLLSHNGAGQLLDGWVEDYLEQAQFVHVGEPVDGLLDRLQPDNALLVGTPSDVVGTMTLIDVLEHCYQLTQPYYVLHDIEHTLRDLIRTCVPAEHLSDAIAAAMGSHSNRAPVVLEDCTFEEYRLIIRCKANRAYFDILVGPGGTMLNARLTKVRDVRNKVMHFKGEPEAAELRELREARLWLRAKLHRLVMRAAA